jgi:hypothetical protein
VHPEDLKSRGLRLRVSPGSRTWLVTFWSPQAKTTRRFKLGDGERMPLSKARAAARKALAAVEVERRDPQAEHNAAKVRAAEERRRRSAERKRAAEERGRRRRWRRPFVLAGCSGRA